MINMKFFTDHKVHIALGVLILFAALFMLSMCNTCTSRNVKTATVTQATIPGVTNVTYSKGAEQVFFEEKTYTGAEIIKAVKPLPVRKKQTGIAAKALLQQHLDETIRAPTDVADNALADSGLYIRKYTIGNTGTMELKITTFPAVDSMKIERLLALTEKQLIRTDTVRLERTDTVKSVITIVEHEGAPWWDKFWIGAVAVAGTVLVIVKAVQ
jgi:hypothetical protein